MKNCCFIIPYFGTFPNYFPLFLKTCSWNKNFNWLLITDNNTHYEYPENFNVIKMSFVELQTLVQSKFDFNIKLREFGIRKPLKKFWEWNIFSTFICDNQ